MIRLFKRLLEICTEVTPSGEYEMRFYLATLLTQDIKPILYASGKVSERILLLDLNDNYIGLVKINNKIHLAFFEKTETIYSSITRNPFFVDHHIFPELDHFFKIGKEGALATLN